MDPIVIALAFVAGAAFRSVGLPPLLGFLMAGFAGNMLGFGSLESLAPIANAGILLLLFTIGLKLDPLDLKPRYVWGSALVHIIVVVPLTAAALTIVSSFYEPLNFGHPAAAWTLAFALSFSSTVLAIKLVEDRGEGASFYARIAIGVLIVQDVLAVLYVVASSGKWPSPWAILLVLLPFAAPLVRRILPAVGHGELLLLTGILCTFGFGALFDAVGLKDGLGALVGGMLVRHWHAEKSRELYRQLAGLKDLLLIGFFVQIGYYGLPSVEMLVVASLIAGLTVLRPLVYFALFVRFGLRARTGFLGGLALFSYSEFGLIVAAIAIETEVLNPVWITTIALALALSYLMSIPMNRVALGLYRRCEGLLSRLERSERLPIERIGSLGDASTVVLGMGRVGRGAYDALNEHALAVIGVEENMSKVTRHEEDGYRCIHGDASDRDFWERTGLVQRDLVLVSLTSHVENKLVAQLALDLGFSGTLAVAARFPDEAKELEDMGCVAYYLYEGLGRDFAQHSIDIHEHIGEHSELESEDAISELPSGSSTRA